MNVCMFVPKVGVMREGSGARVRRAGVFTDSSVPIGGQLGGSATRGIPQIALIPGRGGMVACCRACQLRRGARRIVKHRSARDRRDLCDAFYWYSKRIT